MVRGWTERTNGAMIHKVTVRQRGRRRGRKGAHQQVLDVRVCCTVKARVRHVIDKRGGVQSARQGVGNREKIVVRDAQS